MEYLIGVDLGGTQIRAALASRDGTLLLESRQLTYAHEGTAAVLGRIVETINQVRGGLPDDGQILGIGIGSPGPLDHVSGVIYDPPNLPTLHHVPLRQLLEQQTGLPVVLGNDANAAALGEWMFGAGIGTQHMLYVTVSTGIGGGVIADGRLLLGHRGSAAEVGLHIIDYATGATWEDLASGSGLARAAAQAMFHDPETRLHQFATPATVTAAHVAAAAQVGDACAQQLMNREAELLGIGLVNMLHLYSPEIVLFGGSVVVHNPWLIEQAKQTVQLRALPSYRSVPIQLASLGEKVGLYGALALLIQHLQAQ